MVNEMQFFGRRGRHVWQWGCGTSVIRKVARRDIIRPPFAFPLPLFGCSLKLPINR